MSAKIYDPRKHKNIILTEKSDEIAILDFGKYRALLSCGHACDPNSLTEWCKSRLDDGLSNFTCPAMTNGKKCDKEWPYEEVKMLALLTEDERIHFEEKLNLNLAKNMDLKQCPKCDIFIERVECRLKIECLWCEKNGIKFQFCWQCENEWKNAFDENFCGNIECSNKELDALRNCKFITLDSCIELGMIPSLRACPSCGKLVEHNGLGCKNIRCRECNLEFCFACLLSTIECQKLKNGHSAICVKPIAPIQTRLQRLKLIQVKGI